MKKNILITLLITLPALVFAQTAITVKGTVTDANNEPMPGATVAEKGTTNGVTTAKDGTYQIKTKSNGILVFSYIGSKTQERPVKNATTIDVKLQDDASNLNEVVVTGYGQTSRRGDLTGAISSLKGEEIAKMPIQSVAQALQGRIAGMQVSMADGTPGSEPSITIRGGTSITQSNEPLYVVDGVPQTEGLAFLDPMDIESVDVLKDASSTALYGARGANGVILITTKKIKPSALRLSYDGYVGAKNVTGYIPVLDARGYAYLTYEKAVGRGGDRLLSFENTYGKYADIEKNYAHRPGVNWQKEVLGKTVMNQYHRFSISGGGKETTFNMFFSRSKDQGVLKGGGSDKNIAKLTLTHNVNRQFQLSGIINYSDGLQYGAGTQSNSGRIAFLQTLFQYRPTQGLRGFDSDLEEAIIDDQDPGGATNPTFQSPLLNLETNLRESSAKALNATVALRYTFAKRFTYAGQANFTTGNSKNKTFRTAQNLASIRAGGASGATSEGNSKRFSYNNTLSYNNTFQKKHRLDLTIGQEYINNYAEGFGVNASMFPASNLIWHRLQLAGLSTIPTSYAEGDRLLSFFGRANYNYDGKYIFTTSLRGDGSSKFGEKNLWGIFPSAAFAWKIISEDFMQPYKFLSDLKLRLSYGQAGNNRIANYQAFGTFNTGYYPLNDQIIVSAGQSNLSNSNLKWEAVQSFNIGLDLGLFKQRITLTTELYDNRSKDLLYRSRIPASSGFTEQFRNIGVTSSRGLEFTLNTINVSNKNLTWSSNFNIAFTNTKVLGLSEGENSMLINSWTGVSDYILQVGQPVGMMYGYIKDGLYQVDDFNYNPTNNTYTLKPGVVNDVMTEKPGFIKFKDISGPEGVPDGLITEADRTVIGNANARFSGGLNNNLSYRGFDISVFINWVVGNNILNANLANNSNQFYDYQNTLSFYKNRFNIINASGNRITSPVELAAFNQGKTNPVFDGSTVNRMYDLFVEDGSFLRINNISLGYTFPRKWLTRIKVSNARLYFTANNLYVLTRYSGYDPEVNSVNNPLARGVDFNAYPRARAFVAGVNLSL